MDLQIRFCHTAEGHRIAYGVVGHGSPIVFPAWWINHLQVLWEHPTPRAFFQGLARFHTVVVYDRHGCGLSDRAWTDYSLQTDLRVLETVIDHLKLRRLALFGFSQGAAAAIAYAAQYPRRVSHLLLFGMLVRPLLAGETGEAVAKLLLAHWGLGSQVIADMVVPGADRATSDWVARFQRESATPAVAVQVATTNYDLGDLLARVRARTLVLHRREDVMMPFDEGRDLASRIPKARFVPLEGMMHPVFLGDIGDVLRAVADFLGDPAVPAAEAPTDMARPMPPTLGTLLRQHRERRGLTQEELAERAGAELSVRTVRNLERGSTHPYAHTLVALADALGLSEAEREELLAARAGATGRAAHSPAARSVQKRHLEPLGL